MTLYQLTELEQGDRVAQAMGAEHMSRRCRSVPPSLRHLAQLEWEARMGLPPRPLEYPYTPGRPKQVHWKHWSKEMQP